jgi:hypothetical protein
MIPSLSLRPQHDAACGARGDLGIGLFRLAEPVCLSERRLYALHDLQHQRPRIDRDRHYERLHRPPQSGHDRPLFTNARQDKGGRPAALGAAVSAGPRAVGAGSAKSWAVS